MTLKWNITIQAKLRLKERRRLAFYFPPKNEIHTFRDKHFPSCLCVVSVKLDSLVDWFGKDFKILKKDDEQLLIDVKVNETASKFWVMQYGENIEVVEPVSLRDTIRATAQAILDKHC